MALLEGTALALLVPRLKRSRTSLHNDQKRLGALVCQRLGQGRSARCPKSASVSWPLLLAIGGLLSTGHAITGQYGLGRLGDEKTALTPHRMLHWPLIILVLVHSLPAVYLALQRWGWIHHRAETEL